MLFYQTQKGKSTQNFMVINRIRKLQLHIRIGFKTFYHKIKVKEKKKTEKASSIGNDLKH